MTAGSPRRRFQFRLRTLLIAVTLLAVLCAVASWRIRAMEERDGLLQTLANNGRQCFLGAKLWLWRRGPATVLARNKPLTDEELRAIKAIIPDAYVVDFDGKVLQGRNPIENPKESGPFFPTPAPAKKP